MRRVRKETLISLCAVVAVVALVAGSLLTLQQTSAQSRHSTTSTIKGVSNAYADGGSLTLGAGSSSSSSVGALYPATVGCSLSSAQQTSSGASLGLNGGGQGGAVTDTVSASAYTSSVTVTSSSTVNAVNLLGGVITANTIVVKTHSSATTTTAGVSVDQTTFTNLKVNGQSVNPTPNQTISLAGIGTVVLDERIGLVNTFNNTSLTVNGIDVHITTPILGLPVGTQLIVGHAMSQFTRTAASGLVGARSYGLHSTGVSGSLSALSGPYAFEVIGCYGGHGAVSLGATSLASILSLGAMTDSAMGQIFPSYYPHPGATSEATSTINSLGLGTVGTTLLNTGTINVQANASYVSSSNHSTSGSVTLTNGSILSGLLPSPLPTNPGPNTQLSIPLLGTVTLNEQVVANTSNSVSIRVTAIDIAVTVPLNLLGLPVGAHIYIGVAGAYASIP